MTPNATGMVVEPGSLIHPISAHAVGWVITSPSSALTPASSSSSSSSSSGSSSSSSSSSTSTPAVTDWTLNGFPTILASQVLLPGDNNSVQAGPYTFDIPAGTFSQPVTFQVYTGSLSNFMSKEPQGQQPILAFAIGAMTSGGS